MYSEEILQFFSCVAHLFIVNTLTLQFWACWDMSLVIGLEEKRYGEGSILQGDDLKGSH